MTSTIKPALHELQQPNTKWTMPYGDTDVYDVSDDDEYGVDSAFEAAMVAALDRVEASRAAERVNVCSGICSAPGANVPVRAAAGVQDAVHCTDEPMMAATVTPRQDQFLPISSPLSAGSTSADVSQMSTQPNVLSQDMATFSVDGLARVAPFKDEAGNWNVSCALCGTRMFFNRGRNGNCWWGCPLPTCTGTHGAHQRDAQWAEEDPVFAGDPLGIPCDEETKYLRIRAHDTFDRMWKGSLSCTREEAYITLQSTMELSPKSCHIGRFSRSQCLFFLEAAGEFNPETLDLRH